MFVTAVYNTIGVFFLIWQPNVNSFTTHNVVRRSYGVAYIIDNNLHRPVISHRYERMSKFRVEFILYASRSCDFIPVPDLPLSQVLAIVAIPIPWLDPFCVVPMTLQNFAPM